MSSFKVIDPSFNYKQSVNNKNVKFFKFLKVNIFSETLASAPLNVQIGDVIKLKRFGFKLSDKGQPVSFENTYSNWSVFRNEFKNNDEFEIKVITQKI